MRLAHSDVAYSKGPVKILRSILFPQLLVLDSLVDVWEKTNVSGRRRRRK